MPLPNPSPEASAPTLQRRNREIESRYALSSALAHSRGRAPLREGACSTKSYPWRARIHVSTRIHARWRRSRAAARGAAAVDASIRLRERYGNAAPGPSAHATGASSGAGARVLNTLLLLRVRIQGTSSDRSNPEEKYLQHAYLLL